MVNQIHCISCITQVCAFMLVAYNSDLDFSGHIDFGKARSQDCYCTLLFVSETMFAVLKQTTHLTLFIYKIFGHYELVGLYWFEG